MKGAICVNNNAKASSGAKMILSIFMRAVIYAACTTVTLKMSLSSPFPFFTMLDFGGWPDKG